MSLCVLQFSAAEKLLVLFEMSFNVTEFLKQMVVLQNFQVFHVEIGFVSALELLLGLSRVDSLQDAEATEVLQI